LGDEGKFVKLGCTPSFWALLIPDMNQELDELKLRSNLYCYSAPPHFEMGAGNWQ
jgi:hypothetical protein